MTDSRLDRYLDLLRENGELIEATTDPDSSQLEAETHRLIFQALTKSYLTIFQGDPRHPDWMPMLSNAYAHAAANPDTTYLFATIAGDGTYRLSGRRGTVRFVDVQSGVDMAGLHEKPGPGLETFDLDQFRIGEDGSFSFLWSATRPTGYEGDWIPLDPRANYVFVRQVALDWENETDAQIAIERLDTPSTKPRMTAEEIDAHLVHLTETVRRSTQMFPKMLADKQARGIVNRIELNRYASVGGVVGQDYYEGLFDLAEDEALLVEATIPNDCGYWSAQLFDELFVSIDYVHRQSSLNGHTGYVTEEGRVQIVVSAQDPGVQNWLDTSGYPRGGFMWRWLRCPGGGAPVVSKLPVDRVRKRLDAKTPAFSTEQRGEQMHRRRVGAQLRRRW